MATDEEKEERERKRLEQIESELFYSIDNDDPERLSKLLSDGIDPNTSFCGIDPLGKSLFWCPLHFCCEKGRRRCAQLLLDAGANPDTGDRWCMTPLMYAIQTEWFDMAELMLAAGATVDLQDSRGRTPLTLSVECSDDTAVRMLCEAGADVNVLDLIGRSPMWLAVCKDGHVAHLDALLHNKFNVCDLDCADLREKRTALQAAIVYSHADRLQYVKMLLAAGSEVNHRDEANHNSMLNLLARSKRTGRQKVDVAEELEIARLLIGAGYELNDVPYRSSWYKYGGTAITMAAEQGATQIVQLLLDSGADPDIPDDCGVTSLLSATVNGHLDTCVVLVRANCQLDVSGEVKLDGIQRQVTPLQAAIARGYFAIGRLLLAVGASTGCGKYLCDSSGTVPPHLLEEDGCLFWQWLMDWVSNPLPLTELCVRKMRTVLRRPLAEKLSVLPLPTFVKSCVMLEHVLPEFE